MLGPENAIWDDGEWICWDEINSDLAKAELRACFPQAELELVPIFHDLLEVARTYHHATGSHLQVYGDLGEMFGAITYGIDLHRNYAKGSDGRLGNDFVEIKTITPFKKRSEVTINLDRHFSKVLVVKISREFAVSGRMVDRKSLPKSKGTKLKLGWEMFEHLD